MPLDIIRTSQRRTIALLALGAVFLGLGLLLLVMGGPPLGEIRTALGISRQPEGPRLVFAEPVADYGNLPIDKMVTHYFEFTNHLQILELWNDVAGAVDAQAEQVLMFPSSN